MTPPPDRSALGVPALVAELHDKGIIFSGATIEVSVRGELWVKVVGAPSVGGDEMYSWCAVKDLGEPLLFPGIRNALVGAVREWLSKNCCYLDIRERRSPDRWGDCRLKITVSWEIPSGATAAEDFEHDPDTGADPDPLRALLLAALAVADQKEQAK